MRSFHQRKHAGLRCLRSARLRVRRSRCSVLWELHGSDERCVRSERPSLIKARPLIFDVGEVATRVDVDPLVFQTYKAVAVFVTSLLLVAFCNLMHGTHPDSFDYWSFADFTHWAFVSAIFWVPGGTAGVFAVRRAGLAISTGLWSCVIILLSYLWGVLIFHEKQESAVGAVGAVLLMCVGLIGIAHFSSIEVRPGLDQARAAPRSVEECRPACSDETTPLNGINRANDAQFDLAKYPHCGKSPRCRKTVRLSFSLSASEAEELLHIDVTRYRLGGVQ